MGDELRYAAASPMRGTAVADTVAVRPGLEVVDLSKSFAGIRVLDAFYLSIARGEIHALAGENGSGKSTFIKVLSGYHAPDPGGTVFVDGVALPFGSPGAAHAEGCRFVHQDLGLVATSSIVDNLSFNSGFPCRLGTIRGRELRARVADDLARLGLSLDPRRLVGGLSPAQRTGVAVARAIRSSGGAPVKVLVLDEPTATLPDDEVHQLLDVVRAVAADGVSVLYVTHRLDEIFQLADNVTVLRDGRKVETSAVSEIDRPALIRLLVGGELDEVRAASSELDDAVGTPVLDVRDLRSPSLHGVSLVVRPGDVVGVAGITGSGRESLLATIFGASSPDGGEVRVDGAVLTSGRPNRAMAAGLAYVPPDRAAQGAVMELTARENLTLSDLRPFWRWPILRRVVERDEVASWFTALSIRPEQGSERRLSTFSGGNQQKVLLAKWLRRAPKVLLLDEPTQGVDVGAKAEIHRHLLAAAAAGAAVVVSSTDIDELVALSHRIVVLRDGCVSAELTGEDLTVPSVAAAALGSRAGAL